jgi:hypothetical protein
MAIKAKVTIIGKNAPVVTPRVEPVREQVKSLSDLRKKVEPVVEPPRVEPPKQVVKPLVKQKIINTVYSDKLDVSKPSKYTEHFLK